MTRATACKLVAVLAKAPSRMTPAEIAKAAGMAEGNTREWLNALCDAGAVRRRGSTLIKGPRGGHSAYLYELVRPFQ